MQIQCIVTEQYAQLEPPLKVLFMLQLFRESDIEYISHIIIVFIGQHRFPPCCHEALMSAVYSV